MRWIVLAGFLIVFMTCRGPLGEQAEEAVRHGTGEADSLLMLENDLVRLTLHRHGGALVGFAFRDLPVNPLDWALASDEMPVNNQGGAPFRGHFLCLGRWGSPTAGEKAAGIPHNGEPANSWWDEPGQADPAMLDMYVHAPLEQYRVDRQIRLLPDQAVFEVTETFHNLQSTGRFTAVVQHATLGGDFLDRHTIINSNATKGFNQAMSGEALNTHAYEWPMGKSGPEGAQIDLRLSDHPDGYVSTHVIDEKIGWVTAANAEKGLLIGYVWDAVEYPWLHIWHGMRDGQLWAKGLEFGTTGLGDNLAPDVRATNTFYGRNHNLFIDAQSSVTKSYLCFLMKIPGDFLEVSGISVDEDGFTVRMSIVSGLITSSFQYRHVLSQ